jgi:hypothetical protein
MNTDDLALQPHDCKPIFKHAKKMRRLNRRGKVYGRISTYYFSIPILEGQEIHEKQVRLGRMSDITRADACKKADEIFAHYKETGKFPWAPRHDLPRDVSRIANPERRSWYVQKYAEQNGKCAICEQEKPHLYIDHCHKTSQLRGLLCTRCNTAIGQLMDDPAIIRKAADYVEHFRHALNTAAANGEQSAKVEIGPIVKPLE